MLDPVNHITNTLRLNQRELHTILERYEQEQTGSPAPEREFVRWSYRVESISLVVEHGSGNRVTLPVATRNISRGGISILHSSFIHPGTRCEIMLNIPGGNTQAIPGVVRRCNHVTGRAHEIGIQFDQQVSTKDLLGLDPLNEAYSLESVDPSRLHGSVLIVSTSELDRELYSTFLEDTSLSISAADTIELGVTRAAKGVDIILADYYLDEGTAPAFIQTLIDSGIEVPVIVLTSDKSEHVLDSIREAHAMGMLSKPITRERLMQSIAEFLHSDGDGGPLYTTLTNSDPAYALLGKFLTEITRVALNLEKASRSGDEDDCLKITRSLSGSAAPLGFPDISRLALEAESRITRHGLKDAFHEIRALVIACRRIKNRPAA